MTAAAHIDIEMGRQLDQITREHGCLHAVLFTHDGLVKAASSRLERDAADRIAAAMSGLQKLSQQVTEFCDATTPMTWRRTLVDLDDHTVLVMTAGKLTCLAVSVAAGMADDEVAVITQTAVAVVKAMKDHLSTTGRSM